MEIVPPEAHHRRPVSTGEATGGRTSPFKVNAWSLTLIAACSWLVTIRPFLAIVASAVLVAVGLPRRSPGALPRSIVVLLAAYFASGFAPGWLAVIIQAGLVIAAGAMVARSTQHRSLGLPVLVLLLVVWWCVLLLAHSNVPNLSTGMLGVRKSTLAFVGLVMGWAWPGHSRINVERFVVWLLVAALSVSIVLHLVAPSIENGIVRGAGQATGEYLGHARLQGLFAGPFHVAMAASFLCVWATVHLRRDKVLAPVAGAVGLLALWLSSVRTGYVAVVIGWLCLAVFVGTVGDRARRLCSLALVLVIGALLLSAGLGDQAGGQRSVLALSSDSRFVGRIPQMTEAVHLIERSPLVGWGPGSAGDAMGDLFGPGAVHVTAHNVVLKLAVEGGLLGLVLVGLLLIRVVRRVDATTPQGETALICGSVMAAFGLTGSMIDALPVSFVLFVLIGLAVE